MFEFLINTDTDLFLFLNSLHSPIWDKVMWYISGKTEWLPLYLCILGWMIYRFRWEAIPVIIAIVVLITLSDQLSVILFKNTIQRTRPCHNPDIQQFIHLVRNHCGGTYGFISNHAANSFALAIFTSFIFSNKYYSILIILWASIVSYSRIYLGVHYPGDVIAGAIFGIFLAKLMQFLYLRIPVKLSSKW